MISLNTESQERFSDQLPELIDSKSPRVSIIIPSYNKARYVAEAIQSALVQTYRSFEIIVVDDGSTDHTREVVARFGNQITYIWQENQGLAGARNTGLQASRGELIGLLDADDQWHPGFLETMVSLASACLRAAVYYCRAQGMDVDGLDLPQVLGGPPRQPETMYRAMLRGNFLIPSTILMRRSVAMSAGRFDQTLRSCEDWDLWLRILPKHLFIGTWERLVRYRLHDDSLSSNSTGMKQAAQAVVEKHFGSDDGQWHNWSTEKRRAYGGLYRYQMLTIVQRQRDWKAAATYFRRALQADPTLATDLDLFYDLALGMQPAGYRGTAHGLDLEGNAKCLSNLLRAAVETPLVSQLSNLDRQVFGTAHYALGLVAYNTGQRSFSRHFFLSALYYRPELCRDTLILGNLMKSLFSRPMLEGIKRFGVRACNSWWSVIS